MRRKSNCLPVVPDLRRAGVTEEVPMLFRILLVASTHVERKTRSKSYVWRTSLIILVSLSSGGFMGIREAMTREKFFVKEKIEK